MEEEANEEIITQFWWGFNKESIAEKSFEDV